MLEDSQFLVALVVSQHVLSFLGPLTRALQSVDCNLVDAYNDIELARKYIHDSRNEDCWKKVWSKVNHLASAAGITIDKPRIAGLQCHRANAGAVDHGSSDYYRINVYYRFMNWSLDFLTIMKDLLQFNIWCLRVYQNSGTKK